MDIFEKRFRTVLIHASVSTSISIIFMWWKRHYAVLYVLWSSSTFDRQAGLSGKKLLLLGWRPREEAGNGSRVFTVSMLTVLRPISLTVALAAGSAHATGLDARPIAFQSKLPQMTSRVNRLRIGRGLCIAAPS